MSCEMLAQDKDRKHRCCVVYWMLLTGVSEAATHCHSYASTHSCERLLRGIGTLDYQARTLWI